MTANGIIIGYKGDGDVTVYAVASGALMCESAHHESGELFGVTSAAEMATHVREHVKLGHSVPQVQFARFEHDQLAWQRWLNTFDETGSHVVG
jgi:hypothetical protein